MADIRDGQRRAGGGAGFWPLLTALFGCIAVACAAVAFWALERLPTSPSGPPPPPPEPPEDRRVLEPAAFADLPGWGEDSAADFLAAFLASCERFRRQPSTTAVSPREVGGTVADWLPLCGRAAELPAEDEEVRAFLEAETKPWAVLNRDEALGLFTGYYEPTLQGSRRPTERYRHPLYRRPRDLVQVDLGRFREDLAGRRIAGRLDGGDLVPYADRADIHQGAMDGRALELVWVDDAVDAFFLHIQGSGRVELEGGGFLRVGYAGQNGHPYFAIGRDLVERGALTLEEVSMQSIRRWLEENPEEARAVMERNASYVFFRALDEAAPVGSHGAPLTPGRSLAVDRKFLPMGAPVWLDAAMPSLDPALPDEPLRRLLVAQDTGGAIRGPVRGDVFWGPGDEAAERAGRMKHEGRMWLLLPPGLPPGPAPDGSEPKPSAPPP